MIKIMNIIGKIFMIANIVFGVFQLAIAYNTDTSFSYFIMSFNFFIGGVLLGQEIS